MRSAVRFTALTLAAALVSGTALAQTESPPVAQGLSLTPYLGILIPTAALLKRSTEAPLKLGAAVTGGLRLGIDVGDRFVVDADVGYSPGSLQFDSTGVSANQDVQVLSASGRLTVFVIPRTSPIWFAVSAGGAAIRHTFSKNPSRPTTDIQAGTNVGGVVGASAGFRIGRLLSIDVGAEDYLYNASFEINGTKTAERKQHDVRLSAGVHVPFLGI